MHALYFTATWCQPCKVFGPIMEKLKDVVEVYKFDIEKEPDMVVKFGIMSVPTVIFEKEGEFGEAIETGRFVGVRTEDWVRDFIKEME